MINLTDGRGKLILASQVLKRNPFGCNMFNFDIGWIREFYEKILKNIATDRDFVSKTNQQKSVDHGLISIVFNKIVSSMENLVSRKHMGIKLRK
jgi:hypothetical protein